MARYWVVSAGLVFFLQAAAWCGEALTVAEAVALYRNIATAAPDTLKQKAAREKEAFELLMKGGDASATALLAELKKLKAGNERDDLFELAAGSILFENGGTKYVAEIAEIWNRVPLDLNYPYVFYPAYKASCTKDEKYLPMLAATLRETEVVLFIKMNEADPDLHVPEGGNMPISGHTAHNFIWGPMGRAGIPTLRDVLKTSADETTRVSAARQLANFQDLEALPYIRKLATTGSDHARKIALEMLGEYGHPDDYGLLTEGLKSAENEIILGAVAGLQCYGDLRAVPLLLNCFTGTQNETLKIRTLDALTMLSNSASVEAIFGFKGLSGRLEERRQFYVWAVLTDAKIKPEKFAAMSVEDQKSGFCNARLKVGKTTCFCLRHSAFRHGPNIWKHWKNGLGGV